MEIAIIIISIILGLIFIAFIAGVTTIRFTLYNDPYRKKRDDYHLMSSPQFKEQIDEISAMITHLRSLPYEDLFITSFDKTKLHAMLYEYKSSKKVAIMCHGYSGTPRRDFCGGAPEFMKMGYSVILIDERGHSLSGGRGITFGIKESKDLLCWIKFAKERFGEDIELVLMGISMGGTTVLNVADKVDSNIKIIADCPYASIKEMFYKDIKDLKLPIWIFYPLLKMSALIFMHVNISKFNNYNTIKNARCPILIVHGDQDSVIPYWMSYGLFKVYQDKIRYELFAHADHGISYIIDKQRYREVISDFLSEKQ